MCKKNIFPVEEQGEGGEVASGAIALPCCLPRPHPILRLLWVNEIDSVRAKPELAGLCVGSVSMIRLFRRIGASYLKEDFGFCLSKGYKTHD